MATSGLSCGMQDLSLRAQALCCGARVPEHVGSVVVACRLSS